MREGLATRTRAGFYQTLIIMVTLMACSVCWKSVSPLLKTAGLLIPAASFLIFIFFESLRKKSLSLPVFILILSLFLPLQILLISKSPVASAASRFPPVLIMLFMMFILIYNLNLKTWHQTVWEEALVGIGILFSLLGLSSLLLWFTDWVNASASFSIPPIGFRMGGNLIGHPNIFAAFLNLLLPLALIRFYQSSTKQHKVFWAGTTALFLAAIYQTSSRGGWIGSGVALSVSTLVYFFPQIWKLLRSGSPLSGTLFSRKNVPLIAGALILLGTATALLYWQVQRTGHLPLLSSRGYIWEPAWQAVLDSPFTGHGPGSFAFLYTSYNAPPPAWTTNHAHNLVLQVLVEYGLVGLLLAFSAGAVLTGSILRIFSQEHARYRHLAGVFGASAGLLVHHLVEFAFVDQLYTMTALILAAFILTADTKRREIHVRPILASAGSAALTVLLMTFSIPGFQAQSKYFDGIEPALRGNWVESETHFCAAASADPRNTFYTFQCAIASANNIFNQGGSNYSQSIQMLTDATREDHYWPVHTAALATMLWENQQHDEAVALMEEAVESAPGMSSFHLNLGLMQETEGQAQAAAASFHEVLLGNPFLTFSSLMQKTDLRISEAEIITQMILNEPEQVFNLNSRAFEYHDWMGNYHLASGNLIGAELSFNRSAESSPEMVRSRVGLAEVKLQSGKPEEALPFIREAVFLSPRLISARTTYSRILRSLGEADRAAAEMDTAFSLLSRRSFSLNQYLYAYDQYAPQMDLPIFFIQGILTRDTEAELNWLAQYHVENGSADKSEQIMNYLNRELAY